MDICVLIPAFNEGKVLGRAILSCIEAGLRGHIYVVDDGSTDDTWEVARFYRVSVLSIPNGGKAAALKAGLEEFRLLEQYQWVGILDADSAVDKEYFWRMRSAMFRFPRAAILCGSPKSAPHNWLTAYRAVEYAISLGIYREAQHFLGTVNVAPGCASLYRTDVLATLDLSGGTLVEDMDLTIQAQRRGLEVVYVPDAVVVTQDPRTLPTLVGQLSRWYRGTWQIVRKHRLMRSAKKIDFEMGTLLADGLGYAIMLVLLPFIWRWSPWTVYVAVALDQLLLLTFTLLVAARERRWDVLAAFPLFTIPRLASAFVFAWAFLVERRPTETKWYSVARY